MRTRLLFVLRKTDGAVKVARTELALRIYVEYGVYGRLLWLVETMDFETR